MISDATKGHIWINGPDGVRGLVDVLHPGYHLKL